jgi:hypothetical protein
VGSVKLSVRLWITSAAKAKGRPPYAELIRMHDYKVVAVRTARDNGTERAVYAQNFPLDYALLVRKGFEEFNNTPFGRNLNNNQARLVIKQSGSPDTMGKVVIGGTGSDKFVFLNVHEKFWKEDGTGLVPKPSTPTFKVTFDDCLILFPKIKDMIDQKIDQIMTQLDQQSSSDLMPPPDRATIEQQIYQVLRQSLYGIFTFRHLPAVRDDYNGPDLQEERRIINLIAAREDGPGANIERGIELIGPDLDAFRTCPPDQLLEGDIRSRFLKRVDFHMDGTPNDKIDAAMIEDIKKKTSIYCVETTVDTGAGGALADRQKLVEGLRTLSSKYSKDFFSRLIASYPYKIGVTESTPPGFRTLNHRNLAGAAIPLETSGESGVQPFFHVNLRGKRMETSDLLEQVDIIDPDKGTINLNGYADVQGDVTIGQAGQTLKINGQGGIFSAKGSITINANLEKGSDEAFCVFFTRLGNITVNAERVEASLVALGGGTGRIIFTKPVTVKGAVVTEFLSLANWAAGQHTFIYDPILKSRNPSTDLYVVNLGLPITFQRLVDGRL